MINETTKRINQRSVTITKQGAIFLVLNYIDKGGSSRGHSSASMIMTTKPFVIDDIHGAISYLKVFMMNETVSFPQDGCATEKQKLDYNKNDRSIIVRTARNGFIVEPSFFDGKGWNKAIGDEVVFTNLDEMLKFCTDYLEGKPGMNWWEIPPWKEGSGQ